MYSAFLKALRVVLGQGADISAANPLEVHDPKVGSLISYEGTTTADGAGDGSTLIDSVLTTKPDFNGNLVIITSGDYAGQARDINGVTTGGTVTPHIAFDGQIVSGTTFVVVGIRTTPAEVASLAAKVGTATDAGYAATLFGRHRKLVTAVHAHILVVVHDASSLDADLDTPLKTLLEEFGFTVDVADPTDVAGNLELNYTAVVVSASCVAGDAGNLANLKTAECPVVCHSAAIAVSAVFNLGATAGTEVNQTQIEIVDNTVQWFIDQATGDITLTTAATIYTMATKTANAHTYAEEATGTGNDLVMVYLLQGQDDGGVPAYAPSFDRCFFGIADMGKINVTCKTIIEHLYEHLIHEKRWSPEVIVTAKRVYQEQIPDTGFSISPDTTLTSDPPSADSENSVVDIDRKQNRSFVLRSLWVNITDLGGGTAIMTFKLWVDIGGTATQVDSRDVTSTGYQNLVDIFGLQEVHADSIHITAQVNAGTGACAGIYRYAEAKK